MGVEFEIKFRATPDVLSTIDKAVSGEKQVISMETTYYDTPNGDLAARRYTLRRRMENEKSVCTLKTPAEAGGRQEYELQKNAIEDAIPKLCKLCPVADLPSLLEKGVAPLCGAKFTRIAKTFPFGECVLELALDQGVLIGGGKELPLCEVEVELKSGPREGALAYAALLAERYHLIQEDKSKFKRARDLAQG